MKKSWIIIFIVGATAAFFVAARGDVQSLPIYNAVGGTSKLGGLLGMWLVFAGVFA
jgi:hypothetical protein